MARQSMPASEHSHSNNGVRKRVCKACDRCRLKKSKCDGAKPCGRCRTDNTLCVFGERKKAHDKVYPKGYVEMLEQQQSWLVNGLQELYRRLLEGERWQSEPLKSEPNSQPLTHDLLTQLGALDQSNNERFKENIDVIQQEPWKQKSGYMQRQDSSDTSSESLHSPVMPPRFLDPFAAQASPQTPTTLQIEVPQPAGKSESHVTSKNPIYATSMQITSMPSVVDPSDLQSAQMQNTQWHSPTYATSMQTMSMPSVVGPSDLQSAQMQNTQWSSPGFRPFDDIDLMSAQYSGLQYDDSASSPMFNREVRMECLIPKSYMDNKNDFKDINQFLNMQLEITS